MDQQPSPTRRHKPKSPTTPDTNPCNVPIENWDEEYKVNAQRAANGQPPLTYDQLVEQGLREPMPRPSH